MSNDDINNIDNNTAEDCDEPSDRQNFVASSTDLAAVFNFSTIEPSNAAAARVLEMQNNAKINLSQSIERSSQLEDEASHIKPVSPTIFSPNIGERIKAGVWGSVIFGIVGGFFLESLWFGFGFFLVLVALAFVVVPVAMEMNEYQERRNTWSRQLDNQRTKRRTAEKLRQDAEAANRKALEDAERLRASAAAKLVDEVSNDRARAVRFYQKLGQAGARWDDAVWNDWQPANAMPASLRVGEALAPTTFARRVLKSEHEPIVLPAMAPMPGERGLLVKVHGATRARGLEALQAMAFRSLATVPPGKLRFTFVDPVGLGQSISPLLALGDHDEDLVGSRAWTEPAHIDMRLSELTQHMENVIQKYLRDTYKSIDDYNRHASEVAEPYRLLFIADFPVNFSETSIKRLISIAENGPRCGVVPIVLFDAGKSLPYNFDGRIDDHFSVISDGTLAPVDNDHESRQGRNYDFVWLEDGIRSWPVALDPAPPSPLVSRVIESLGPLAKVGMGVSVPYARLLQHAGLLDENGFWSPQSTSADELRVPLGPSGARKFQELVLGRGTAHHALIIGQTGSGKSNLLHVLITTLTLSYSPSELQLYLIDFKKGVEFKLYAQAGLPHARVIAIQSEREFGLSVLRGLLAEMDRRGELFRSEGVPNLPDYRRKTGERMPRVLLIVDEFRVFFEADDKIASDATMILDRLVSQGRGFGIHVLLASQTLAGSYTLSRSILDQMAVRIVLQCTEADSRLALADDNPEARLLSRPGEAIYNDAQGLIEGNHRFQVADMGNDEEREAVIRERLCPLIEKYGHGIDRPVVFEGHLPARIEDCRPLAEAIERATWPEDRRFVEFWIGEALTLDPAVSLRLARQSGAHALLVLRDEEQALSLLHTAILAIAAQQSPARARFVVVDLSSADGTWPDRTRRLAQTMPHTVAVCERRGLMSRLDEIGQLVEERLEAEDTTAPALYLILVGLHRMRDLREEDGGLGAYGFDSEAKAVGPRQRLATILREGPECGVHVLAWADTVNGAMKALDRRMLGEMALRVAGPMSEQDSMALLDEPTAARIDRPHRLIGYDEDKPGQLVTFRPYIVKDEAWVAAAAERLAARPSP